MRHLGLALVALPILCGSALAAPPAQLRKLEFNEQLAAQGRATRAWVVTHPKEAKRIVQLTNRARTWDQLRPNVVQWAALDRLGLGFALRAVDKVAGMRSAAAWAKVNPLTTARTAWIRGQLESRDIDPGRFDNHDIGYLAEHYTKQLK